MTINVVLHFANKYQLASKSLQYSFITTIIASQQCPYTKNAHELQGRNLSRRAAKVSDVPAYANVPGLKFFLRITKWHFLIYSHR